MFNKLEDSVKNIILYNYLDCKDIVNCLRAHRCFHVLTKYQLSVVKHVSRGVPRCFDKIDNVNRPDILHIVQRLHNIDFYKEYMYRNINYSLIELVFIKGHKDVARLLVKLATSANKPVVIHTNVSNMQQQTAKLYLIRWLRKVEKEEDITISMHFEIF